MTRVIRLDDYKRVWYLDTKIVVLSHKKKTINIVTILGGLYINFDILQIVHFVFIVFIQ